MKVDDEEALIAKMWDAWRESAESGVGSRRDCMAAVLVAVRAQHEQAAQQLRAEIEHLGQLVMDREVAAQQRIEAARAAAFREAAHVDCGDVGCQNIFARAVVVAEAELNKIVAETRVAVFKEAAELLRLKSTYWGEKAEGRSAVLLAATWIDAAIEEAAKR